MDNSSIYNGMANQSLPPEHPPVASYTTYGQHTTCPFVAQQQAQRAQQAQQAQPVFATNQSATATSQYNDPFVNLRPPTQSFYHIGQHQHPSQPDLILPTPYNQHPPPALHHTYFNGAPGLFNMSTAVFPAIQQSPDLTPYNVPSMQPTSGNAPGGSPAAVPRAIGQQLPAGVSPSFQNNTFPGLHSGSASTNGSGQRDRDIATLRRLHEVAQTFFTASPPPFQHPDRQSPILAVPIPHVSMPQTSPMRETATSATGPATARATGSESSHFEFRGRGPNNTSFADGAWSYALQRQRAGTRLPDRREYLAASPEPVTYGDAHELPSQSRRADELSMSRITSSRPGQSRSMRMRRRPERFIRQQSPHDESPNRQAGSPTPGNASAPRGSTNHASSMPDEGPRRRRAPRLPVRTTANVPVDTPAAAHQSRLAFLRRCTGPRGVSASAFESLESVEIKSLPEEERTCIICYNDFGVPSPEGINEAPLRLPKCKHIFGDHCIKKWFTEATSCPYCRDKLPSNAQHTLQEYLRARHQGRPSFDEEVDLLFRTADSSMLGIGLRSTSLSPTDSAPESATGDSQDAHDSNAGNAVHPLFPRYVQTMRQEVAPRAPPSGSTGRRAALEPLENGRRRRMRLSGTSSSPPSQLSVTSAQQSTQSNTSMSPNEIQSLMPNPITNQRPQPEPLRSANDDLGRVPAETPNMAPRASSVVRDQVIDGSVEHFIHMTRFSMEQRPVSMHVSALSSASAALGTFSGGHSTGTAQSSTPAAGILPQPLHLRPQSLSGTRSDASSQTSPPSTPEEPEY